MMYVCIAYRWGWTNGQQYIVYAGPDRTKAHALAQAEADDRAGKYGVVVMEFDADGTACTHVAYWPSAYGEMLPEHNGRKDDLESLGLLLESYVRGDVYLPDEDESGCRKMVKRDVAPAPDWLVGEVRRREDFRERAAEILRQHKTEKANGNG